MKKEWNHFIDGTSMVLEEGVVHLLNDENLVSILKDGSKGPRYMAREIRAAHRKMYGRELTITQKSLTCEIHMHYKIGKCCEKLAKIFGNHGIIRRFLRATAVIDCGEKGTDGNRFVWDMLQFFYRK